MDLTEGDFQQWLDNPVTRAVKTWAKEQQDALVNEIAEAIVDGAVVSVEEQHIRHGMSEVYQQIYQLKYEDIDDSGDIEVSE